MADWKKVLEDLQERNLITTKEASELQKFNEDLEKSAIKIPVGKGKVGVGAKVVNFLGNRRFHNALIGGILAMPAISGLINKITGPLAYNRDYNRMKDSLDRRYPSTMQDVKRNKNEEKLHEAFEVLYKFSPAIASTPTLASDAVKNFYDNRDIFTLDALKKLVDIQDKSPKSTPVVGLLRSTVVDKVTEEVGRRARIGSYKTVIEVRDWGKNEVAKGKVEHDLMMKNIDKKTYDKKMADLTGKDKKSGK